ncbi:hypothetical protein FGIG_07258 [Fasciola gigantica]|uniref:Uncharacterized protein n=1 Tax=Fasciola gigantica TaxID=46835 RepID=A0A504YY33_FASGI|nr:hypothetical protein FGIG_07257 [Fasciola gigantica]TPP62778.1 hypothetical protein FGIG_07258 [Fasciola gigantica]
MPVHRYQFFSLHATAEFGFTKNNWMCIAWSRCGPVDFVQLRPTETLESTDRARDKTTRRNRSVRSVQFIPASYRRKRYPCNEFGC